MAFQSMLIVLIGSTPDYRVEQQQQLVPSSSQELVQKVVFTEDVDSIVTEVSCQDSARSCLLCDIRLVPVSVSSGSSSSSRLTR